MRWNAFALVIALLWAASSEAVVVSRQYDFEADTPIIADQLNSELDNILSALNGNLNGTDNIVQNAISTGNIATAAVTTAKIASGNVTKVKLAALGQATSNSSLTRYLSSEQEVQVDTLTASLTPTGRPVWVGLQSIAGVQGRVLVQHNGGGATDNSAFVNFRRDGATANMVAVGVRQTAAGAISNYPCSAFWFMDTPDGGVSHAYTVWARVATSDSGIVRIENCKLVLFEL